MSAKLDIFSVLSFMDENNLGIHEALRDEGDMLKDLERNANWMLPQWMTGSTNPEAHAMLVDNFNTVCNEGWFDLYYHPELQVKLLACCGLGRRVKHKFFKPTKALQVSKMARFLEHKYVDIREDEVALWCRKNSKASLKRLAEAYGYLPDEVKELEKAFDALRKQF